MSLRDESSVSNPSSHLYPQAIQLKLYQAFIFSIPVLFSIILFLLFYLFYLKRRTLAAASASASPSRTNTGDQSSNTDHHLKGISKEKLKEIMPSVPFNEDLLVEDAICCVCLGEFEMSEELIQIPVCKHIFHLDCIHNWLSSHSTCPLCRCSVYLHSDNKKLIIVSTRSPIRDLADIGGSDHNSQVVISLASLESQEHVIQVSDLLDRIANLESTNTSHSQHLDQ